jgi:GH15 family glucan-1,4-alpha-glucosidase
VRIGNKAATQQLDVYGEVIDALSLARSAGLEQNADAWSFQRVLLEFLESRWDEPDNGIWEIRGDRKQFTHSKVMAWVARDPADVDARRGRQHRPAIFRGAPGRPNIGAAA